MNKKKKWLSLLTIATSLILCIISTFGITLAFFGGNASANLSTITLKTGIEIGAAIESSVGTAKVVPGQPITITATGTLSATDKGNPTAENAVDGVVRAKFNIGNDLGDVTISGGEDADVWVKSGDYYYLTEDDQTTLREVTVGESVKIYGTLTVSKNFTNADSGKSVEASVIFETIQADVYDSVTGEQVEMTIANATTSTSPLYSAFSVVKPAEKYDVTIVAEYPNPNSYSDALLNRSLYFQFDNEDPIQLTSATTITGKASVLSIYNTAGTYNCAEYIIYDHKGGTQLYYFLSTGEIKTETITLTGDTSYYIVMRTEQHIGSSD